jgi:hypothetical protein
VSAFLDRLQLEYRRGEARPWVGVNPWRYQSDVAGRIITVPTGFPSDLASTPRVPIIYEMFGNIAIEEAYLHDYLYTSGRESRAVADAVLREACALGGMSWWRRWGMWAGVRLGGHFHYTKTPAGSPTESQ